MKIFSYFTKGCTIKLNFQISKLTVKHIHQPSSTTINNCMNLNLVLHLIVLN